MCSAMFGAKLMTRLVSSHIADLFFGAVVFEAVH